MPYHAGQYVNVAVPQCPRRWRYLTPAIPPDWGYFGTGGGIYWTCDVSGLTGAVRLSTCAMNACGGFTACARR